MKNTPNKSNAEPQVQINTQLGNKEIFARNLGRYVSASGLTQKEIAMAVSVSTSTFSDWMKGVTYPRMEKVQALANYFGIQSSDLVDDVSIAKDLISDEDQKVLDLFHKIPQEKREFILSMIRAAIDNL